MIEGETDELGQRRFVTYHLRNIKQSRLKRSRATRNQRRRSI